MLGSLEEEYARGKERGEIGETALPPSHTRSSPSSAPNPHNLLHVLTAGIPIENVMKEPRAHDFSKVYYHLFLKKSCAIIHASSSIHL